MVDATSTVNESTFSPDGTVAAPADDEDAADDAADVGADADDDDDDDGDELQPAAVRAATAPTIATQPDRRKRRDVPSPCKRER
jgi:hypothetical protein